MSRAADLIGHHEPGTPEWHALRATGLGGSEIAAVLGLSPYESRFSLWHRKQGLAAPQDDNPAMRAGRYLEPAVAAMFADNHPEWTIETTGTWRNRERPYQIANPDRLVNGRQALEVKTARDAHGWGEPGTDEIPVHYRCQVLWYLDALGLDRAHVAVLISGQDYAEYVVDYDADEVAILRAAGEEFVRTVADGERPSIDAHGETYQIIRELHPDIDDVSIELDEQVAADYRNAVAEHKRAEAEKKRATAAVADAMGTARRAYTAGQPVAIRKAARAGATPHVAPAPAARTTRTTTEEAAA